MVRNEHRKLNISQKELHLLDIYSNESKYLQIGTIPLDSLQRLLNYEMVQLDDISYIPIQNFGFNQSTIKNESLKAILPYFYFQNINQKSTSQVFITHGMIKYKDQDKKEKFSPLILIPVNIYYENNRIFFQMISDPIENSILTTLLQKQKKMNIPTSERLDNLFNIAKFFSVFERQFEFILENFITYSEIISPENLLDLNKFNLTRTYPDYLYENLYGYDKLVYYSKQYNRNQRYALRQALDNQSFVITGRLGTGKTTVLRDIAINAILNDKKVLYVSNQKETLDDVYNFFKSKNMHYYVANFTNSFSSFHNLEQSQENDNYYPADIDITPLLDNYEYIKDYQNAMSGRILNHRFIDIINDLIMLTHENKKKLDINNLDNIYKFEYLEIVKALEVIQDNLIEIEDFKNCVWKDIPIINDIKYPNQVISLIHKVYIGFSELEKNKDILEQKFGFKSVDNYAYLKNILHNFKNFNVLNLPKSWLDKKKYELAKVEFHKLKTLIYTLQELEYDLDIRFDNLTSFNIEEEIKLLYGEFFDRNDLSKINRIIDDRLNIIVKLNKVFVQIDIFNKAYSKLKKILNYDFTLDSEVLLEIIKLCEIFSETNINFEMINVVLLGKYNEVKLEAEKCLTNYLQYKSELNSLFNGLPLISFGETDETVNTFLEYSKGSKIKRSFKRILDRLVIEDKEGYDKIINLIPRFFALKQLIKEEDEKFLELFDFHPDQVYLDDLTKLNDYLESIKDLKIKSRIIKFLRKFDTYAKNIYRYFDYFYKSYLRINSLYEELIQYEFTSQKEEFKDKLTDLKQINNYIQKAFNSNDKLYSLKKINKNDYVTAEDYYYIYESVKKISEIKQQLKTSQDFSDLFGEFYQFERTDLSKLSKEMQAFKLYADCFSSDEALINSVNEKTYNEITDILEICLQAVADLNEVFKIYFKIFKNSVSRLYYTDFKENIAYLNELIKNKESLIIYLKITDGLQVLAKYQLYKLIEYIVHQNDPSNLVSDFKYTYLSRVKEMYLEKYPYLKNYKAFEATLKITLDLEEELIKDIELRTFQKIIKKSATRFSLLGVKNLDYSSYLRKTSNIKHLILTNTQVLNNYLNIKDFDLVLVDDAQLFSASEYAYALQGKQVIVAGELQLQEAVANNLISRISLSKNIVFTHRYSVMPKSLKNYTIGLSSPTYRNYYDNFGVEVITKDIYLFITSLFKVNIDITVNIFTSNLSTQRLIYDELANLLLESGFNTNQIIEIIHKKINIADLKQAYLVNADYNIVFLEDYYQTNEDYLVVNMIDNLVLVKRKLVIFDNNEYLKEANKSNFIIELEKLVAKQIAFEKTDFPKLINKLVKKLEEYKIQSFASEISSFTIKAKSNIYGITIYWDSTKTNYDILNEFRDYHFIENPEFKKIIVIWAMELLEDFDGVVQRLVNEVYND